MTVFSSSSDSNDFIFLITPIHALTTLCTCSSKESVSSRILPRFLAIYTNRMQALLMNVPLNIMLSLIDGGYITKILVLPAFKNKKNSFTQEVIILRQFSISSIAWTCNAGTNAFISWWLSAKPNIGLIKGYSERIYMLNKGGPKTDPCATP